MNEQQGFTPDVQRDIERAVAILKGGGCRAVFVFGSAAQGATTDTSDIDLAVEGCPSGDFFRLYGRLLMELERSVDLVSLDWDDPFVEFLRSRGGLRRVG